MQPVKVALAEGQVTILDSGPAPGTSVVVDGADRLRPGQPVTVNLARQRASQGAGQAPATGEPPAALGTGSKRGAQLCGPGQHERQG